MPRVILRKKYIKERDNSSICNNKDSIRIRIQGYQVVLGYKVVFVTLLKSFSVISLKNANLIKNLTVNKNIAKSTF